MTDETTTQAAGSGDDAGAGPPAGSGGDAGAGPPAGSDTDPREGADVNENAPGEQADVVSDIWAEHLDSQVRITREMGVESHTRIVDVDQNPHEVELGSDIERIEPAGRHTRIWLRNAGIITVTGGAIAAAVAIIRHRHRGGG